MDNIPKHAPAFSFISSISCGLYNTINTKYVWIRYVNRIILIQSHFC